VFPKPVQGFRQARRAQFRGSTGGFYQLRQFDHVYLITPFSSILKKQFKHRVTESTEK